MLRCARWGQRPVRDPGWTGPGSRGRLRPHHDVQGSRCCGAGLCGTDLHIRAWDPCGPPRPESLHSSSVTSSMARSSRSAGRPGRHRVHRRPGSPARVTSSAGTAATAGPTDATSASARSASASAGTGPSPTSSMSRRAAPCPARQVSTPTSGRSSDPVGNATHTASSGPMVRGDVLILISVIATTMPGAPMRGTSSSPTCRCPARPGALARTDLSWSTPGSRASGTRRRARDAQGLRYRARMSAPANSRELIDNMNHGGRVAMLGLPPRHTRSTGAKVITHAERSGGSMGGKCT